MTTYYKRSIRRRFYSWLDDCRFAWERNRDGFYCGLLLGALVVLIAFEFAISV